MPIMPASLRSTLLLPLLCLALGGGCASMGQKNAEDVAHQPAAGAEISDEVKTHLGFGIQSIRDGKATQGIEALAKAVALDDRSVMPILDMAADGQFPLSDEERAQMVALAKAHDPRLPESEAEDVKAQASELLGHWHIFELTELIEANAYDTEAYRGRAEVYQSMGELDKALVDLNAALESDMYAAGAWLDRCQLHYHQEDYEKALNDCQRARELRPDSMAPVMWEGRVHLALEDYESATTFFAQVLKNTAEDDIPGQILTLLQYSLALQGLEKYDEAMMALNRADGLMPGHPWVLLNRGLLALELEAYHGAVEDLSQALAVDDSMKMALPARGMAHMELGHYDKALADFSAAIEADPELSIAYIGRLETYRRLNDYEKALSDAQKAYDLNPENLGRRIDLGDTLLGVGQEAEGVELLGGAKASYLESLDQGDGDNGVLVNLSWVHFLLSDYGACIDFAEKALAANPEEKEAFYNAAICHFSLGEFKKARTYYEKGLAFSPSPGNIVALRRQIARGIHPDMGHQLMRDIFGVDER